MGETLEILECRRALETTLRKLDGLGAGIAAIHVNAAIEQLTGNLETIGQSRLVKLDTGQIAICDEPRVTH